MKKILFLLSMLFIGMSAVAQTSQKVYDETLNPATQIKEAVSKASKENKYVVAQLGGNWCKWCIRFARFVEGDPEIKSLVDDNFEFIHVNYNPRNPEADNNKDATGEALRMLGNPVRFGYPVLVVLDSDGNVVHIQDSSFLESGEGYDKKKVLRFFNAWTPEAVRKSKK